MRWLAALVCLLALLLRSQALLAASPEVARFALVIGNNQPEKAGDQQLRYADDDAVSTHRLLLEAGVDSALFVSPDADTRNLNPTLVPAGAPRLSELERGFAALGARLTAKKRSGFRTELLLFYSGHGDVDRGEGYVILEDGRLTRTKLYELLARSQADKNHVFVDACKSFFLAFEKGPGGRRAPYASAFLAPAVPSQLANTGFVLSTSSDRESHEWERYQAGILSHELRSALRGAADTDLDGRVTYAEIGAFLAVANRSIPNEKYRPDFLVRPPGRDLSNAVLSWQPRTAALRLDGPLLGHVYVETAEGIRVLDAHPAAGQALSLHAPSERPLFVRQNDEARELVVTSQEPALVASLDGPPPQIAERGALHLAFERLFAAPFGRDNVSEFELAARSLAPFGPEPPARDRVAPPSDTGRRVLGITAGSVAIGAGAAGLTLSTLAIVNYVNAEGASQVELKRANARIRTLNLASLACYGAAAVAGAAWAYTELSSHTTLSVAPEATNARALAGVRVTLDRRF